MGLTFNLGRVSPSVFTDSSLNVGIGGSPSGSYKLEVTGTAKVSSTLLVSGALTGSAVATFTAAANPLILKSTSATTGYTEYYYNTSTLAGIIGNGGGILTGANNSDFIVRSEADFVVATGGNNRRLTIASTGKLQAINSLADVALDIRNTNSAGYGAAIQGGNGSSNYSLKVVNYNDSATYLYVRGDGNVGIGTSSPSGLLHLSGANTAYRGQLTIQSTDYAQITFYKGATTNTDLNASIFSNISTSEFVIRNNANAAMIFDTNATERMRITSGGDLLLKDTSGNTAMTFTQVGSNIVQANSSNLILQSTGFNVYIRPNASYRTYIDGGTGLSITGSLSKGSGSFRIEHPLQSLSKTHELVHSFIEGPKADLIYRGKLTLANGKGQANIDEVSTMTEGTFEVLCREVQCFTTNESGWDLVKGKVIGNIIYIESQNANSTDEISWMVIGERKDKHMIDTEWTDKNGKVIVEPLKPIGIKP